MKDKTPQELIELCKQHNEDAFTELYKRYYPHAYKLAFHIAKSEADARDAAQETMISVYHHIDELQYPQYFPLWMKRIVVGQCNRIFRKEHHVDYLGEEAQVMKTTATKSREDDPIRVIHFDSDQETLRFFMELLPDDQMRVMEMFYFDQLSIKEISTKLHIPQGTIKSRLFTGKKRLKDMIVSYERDEQVSLDFQSDALMGMLGVSALSQMVYMPLAKFRSMAPSKCIAVAVAGVMSVAVAVSGYYIWNEKATSDEYQDSAYHQEVKPFPTVVLSDSEISSAQDAYFSLLLLADKKADVALLSEQKQEDADKLYRSLKEYGGYYYELIWNEAF